MIAKRLGINDETRPDARPRCRNQTLRRCLQAFTEALEAGQGNKLCSRSVVELCNRY